MRKNNTIKVDLQVKNEEKFNEVFKNNQDLIKLSLIKCNIKPKDYAEFYSNALEGLVMSYIMLEKNYISYEDFKAFAFVAMRRKIIDELRRRKRWVIIPLGDYENLYSFREKGNEIEKIDFYLSVEKILNEEELIFFKIYQKNRDVIKTGKELHIGKTKSYILFNRIKNKCYSLLYKYN